MQVECELTEGYVWKGKKLRPRGRRESAEEDKQSVGGRPLKAPVQWNVTKTPKMKSRLVPSGEGKGRPRAVIRSACTSNQSAAGKNGPWKGILKNYSSLG